MRKFWVKIMILPRFLGTIFETLSGICEAPSPDPLRGNLFISPSLMDVDPHEQIPAVTRV